MRSLVEKYDLNVAFQSSLEIVCCPSLSALVLQSTAWKIKFLNALTFDPFYVSTDDSVHSDV